MLKQTMSNSLYEMYIFIYLSSNNLDLAYRFIAKVTYSNLTSQPNQTSSQIFFDSKYLHIHMCMFVNERFG